jgi:nickel-type superoxide dismutase maturation protease
MISKAGLKEKLLLLVGRRKMFRVEGNSMIPTLKEGDIVLIDPNARLQTGEIVLADHPYKKNVKMLKRFSGFTETAELILIGDNAQESTDSRTFGSVPRICFKGIVTSRLRQRRDQS